MTECHETVAKALRRLVDEPMNWRKAGRAPCSLPSPSRPRHGRHNWFIGVARFAAPVAAFEGEIRFETMRSSGPGGQHVNTTESAVRAATVAQRADRRMAHHQVARGNPARIFRGDQFKPSP